jgi:two-component system, response regulator PdtaR
LALLPTPDMKPRWRVVVIDDHGASRIAVAEAVSAQGGQIVAASDRTTEVLELVQRHRPDAAVIAVGLADGDGIEAARGVSAACPVVLLTSHTEAQVAARAAEAGVQGLLAKPLRPEELGPTLDLAISRFGDLLAARAENQALKRQLESRKLVERAKGLLIQRLGLTEPEAHRRIQKAAMDTRRPMAEVARALLTKQ